MLSFIKTSTVMLFFITTLSSAQAPDSLWVKAYGYEGLDYLYSVVPMDDGGFLACGWTHTDDNDADAYVVKTDADGNTIWTETYGDPIDTERLYSMEPTSDGGFILAGARYSVETDQTDVYMIKLDAAGDLEWTNNCGSSTASETMVSVQQTYDHGYILSGEIYDEELPSHYAAVILKTDSLGNPELWNVLDWEWTERANYAIQTTDSIYVVVGSTNSFGNHYYDAFLVGLSPADLQLNWIMLYGGDKDEYGNHVMQTSDGGFLLTGAQQQIQDVLNSNDFFVVKTNDNGIIHWSAVHGGGNNDIARFAVEHPESGYVICGSGAPQGGSFDAYLMRLGTESDLMWEGHYGLGSTENARCIRNLDGGGFIVSGLTNSMGAGSLDGCLFRIGADDVGVDDDAHAEMPKGIQLQQNIPNPFNGSTHVEYTLPGTSFVRATLYNALGQNLGILHEAMETAGQHDLQINLQNQAGGIYFLYLEANGQSAAIKLCYIK